MAGVVGGRTGADGLPDDSGIVEVVMAGFAVGETDGFADCLRTEDQVGNVVLSVLSAGEL